MIDSLYLLIPLLAKCAAPRSKLVDLFVVLALWLPVELGAIRSGWAPILGGAEIVVLYQYLWPFPQPWRLGLRWAVTGRDLCFAIAGLAGLSLVLIPLGFAIGFFQWSPHALSFSRAGLILVFAFLEEILFRGLIQNALEKALGNRWLALVLASGIFGLAHLNNHSAFSHPPNWLYVAMASLAGLGYGWVWVQTRNTLASSLTHTAVNALWKRLFV